MARGRGRRGGQEDGVGRSQQIGLSKSKYLAGLQCEKRLWMRCREPGLAAEPDAGTLAVMEMGDEVGKCAHLLFPGGVLVAEKHWQHAEAMRRTRELLRNATSPRSSRRPSSTRAYGFVWMCSNAWATGASACGR